MRTVIQNAIVDYCKAATFLPVRYTEADGAVLGDTPVAPSSVEANEVRSQFGQDPVHRQDYRHDILRWEWELLLGFNQEVSLTEFEAALNSAPICIPKGEDMPRTAKVQLEGADYSHPARMSASNGTKALYRFVVLLSPN